MTAAVRIQHAELTLDDAMSDVLAVNDPDAGVASVILRPASKRPTTLLHDIAAALGKEQRGQDRPEQVQTDTANVVAYLHAQEITHLIVGHSQWAWESSGLLSTAFDLSAVVGATLTLVSEYGLPEPAAFFVQQHGGAETTWPQVRASLPTTRTRPHEPVDGENNALPLEVPMVDFMHFRSACKRQLTDAEFTAVDALYVRAYQHTRRHLPPDADSADAAEVLRQLFTDVRTPAAASIVARACQAAALAEHSKLLKIALDQIPYLVSQAAHRSLSDPEMRLVRRIHEPWKAASVVLADAGLSNDDTVALTMADISPGGTVANVDSLSTEARLHIRAQHHTRRGDAAGRKDQFIPHPPRAVRNALFAARRDLRIPLQLTRWHASRGQDRWQQMLGVNIVAVNA